MNPLVNIWRRIILGKGKSWVVFANGTSVILMDPQDDLEAQAIEHARVGSGARRQPCGRFQCHFST